MAETFVGKAADFAEGDRKIVFDGENEIGVFRNGRNTTPTAITVCTRVGPRVKV